MQEKKVINVMASLCVVISMMFASTVFAALEDGGEEIIEIGYGGNDPACTMYAEPDTINAGGGTTLHWDVNEYTVRAYLHPKGSGSWMQEVPLDGSWWISGITDSRVYTLTVENEEGVTATCDAPITVNEGVNEELTCEMYADPSTIAQNGGTNLVWSSTGNVVNAKLHPTGSTSYFADVSANGSWWISGISNNRSYSVTLWDAQGNTVTCDAPISVIEEQEEPVCYDWDGDGWGWDGEKGCKVEAVTETAECYDWDGDGWGWDGEKGCKVESTVQH
ncbi:MAG: hypothetical protein CR972_02365 [Candidatus Moraniibacteriota bacterium]|nr:MAG: hypothetical protein CR972_02365 [Candidatus Moranbacteria bacterium]